MTLNIILPLLLFALTMSITPGPNNIMVTASGANFGFKKTIPHMLGVEIGFSLLMLLSALGLQKLFIYFPELKTLLKVTGVSYMLFLAFKIIRSKGPSEGENASKPFTFFQAVLFQVVNPKAVMMAITAMSVYTIKGDLFFISALTVILAFITAGIPSISLWAGFGTFIGKKLKNGKILKIFNYSMGGLTACSAVLLIF